MKILITGTHSTGKSTLLTELQKQPEFSDFKFIGGVTREAKSFGININEDGSDDTQLYCISKDTLNLLQNQVSNIVFDRSIIDTYIYSKYLYITGKIQKNTLDLVENLYLRFKYSFDYIFWIRPEFKPVEDGVRSININFQIEIDYLFEQEFIEFDKKIYILSGTTENRIKQLNEIVWK